MEHQGKLLHKLVKRKKLTQMQAANALGFSREKLNRLFNREVIDEVTREDIEKIFQVPASYFIGDDSSEKKQIVAPVAEPGCWQLLAEARQQVIDLQQQIIRMSTPNINAPKIKENA